MTFLSSEWLAALHSAANEDPGVRDAVAAPRPGGREPDTGGVDETIVLRQSITGCPPDDRLVEYQLELTDKGATVGAVDRGRPADVTFRLDHGAAWAVFSGEANAQMLLIEGRLTVDGDVGALGRRSAVFSALGDAFASVRTVTVRADRAANSELR